MSEAISHPDEQNEANPYQVMPKMGDDALKGLKEDIRENGVEDPVHVDENGDIIDGHHRVEICDTLGINDYPTKIHVGLSEQEKRDLAYRLNLQQRHLEHGQKQEIVEQYLTDDWDGDRSGPDDETPWQVGVANTLGVGDGTVKRAYRDTKEDGKLVHLDLFPKSDRRQQVRDYIDGYPDASNREVADSIEADVSYKTVGNWRNEWESDDEDEQDEDDESQVSFSAFSPTGDDSDRENAKEVGDAANDGDETAREQAEKVDEGETTVDSAHETVVEEQDDDDDNGSNGSDIDQFTSQETDEWSSPPEVVRPLDDAIGGFDLDPCSGAESSPFASNTFTEDDDGVEQEWFGTVWVNPPYSDMRSWVEKAVTETLRGEIDRIVFLCKGDSSTQWWQKAAWHASLITAINGRLSFGDGENAAPFPSHIIVFGDVDSALVDALGEQGMVLTVGWDNE